MYNIIAFISVIIRQFFLPNPFEPRTDAIILNWIAEPLLYVITYLIVGIFYDEGSEPALGSFLYLVFYAIHVVLLMLIGFFQWTKIAIIIIVVLYLCILGIVKCIITK